MIAHHRVALAFCTLLALAAMGCGNEADDDDDDDTTTEEDSGTPEADAGDPDDTDGGTGDPDGGAEVQCAASEFPCVDTCCACPAADGTVITWQLEELDTVALAVGATPDAGGPMVVTVAFTNGGLVSFDSNECGGFVPTWQILPGPVMTGLAVADLQGSGRAREIVAFSAALDLYALDGSELSQLWGAQVNGLANAGPIVAMRLDEDDDQDVAVFSRNYTQLASIETDDGQWAIQEQAGLPLDIQGVAAGDLGGNSRDEALFMGTGGVVQAVSVEDYLYTDDRFITPGDHARAVFTDFDGDGNGDVVISSTSSLEFWQGDGETNVTLIGAASAGDSTVLDLALFTEDEQQGGALLADGTVVLFRIIDDAFVFSEPLDTIPGALRLLLADINADGVEDVVVVGNDGSLSVSLRGSKK